MLRVGLTGDLGSGKSTVARLFAERGAIVLSSDAMARAMMVPGQPLFEAIVAQFGASILTPGGGLDRRALARLAFDPARPRVEELNALVHPAVLSAQHQQIAELAQSSPHAIVVIESALIFRTPTTPGFLSWRERFDRIVLVTAPEALKIARFVERAAAGRPLGAEERAALEQDARLRLREQQATRTAASDCLVLLNEGSLADLEPQVDAAWNELLTLEEGGRRRPEAGKQ